MSKRKLKITILIKLVPLWLLSWIPFPGGGGVLNNAIDRAYLHALNDYRNLKIDENNAVMEENGVKLKNLNKKL